MPISEDEYEHRSSSYEPSSTMSKAELRKTHKPIMEKRRRARINHCLNEIKTLILDAMKKDPARHSKLEKADILEMAVRHLQNVQRQQLALAMATDPTVLRKFKAGFNECAEEVTKYIRSLEGLDAGVQHKISQHLSKCISGIEQIVHLNFPGFGGVPFLSNSANIFTPPVAETKVESSGDQNNNPSFQIQTNLQLIPSRLSTGELALLLPNSGNLSCFPNAQESTRSSAFVAVIPSTLNNILQKPPSPTKQTQRPLSPPQSPTSSSSDFVNKVPSPHGFRPVSTSRIQTNFGLSLQPDTQHRVSSTSTSPVQCQISPQHEVKSIRFPIQKSIATIQSNKLIEPLSIITNHSERYKQAHVLEESANYEENYQRAVKRKSESTYPPGLLTVAPNKILKTVHGTNISDYKVNKTCDELQNLSVPSLEFSDASTSMPVAVEIKHDFQKLLPSTSKSHIRENNIESSNDMWRPW